MSWPLREEKKSPPRTSSTEDRTGQLIDYVESLVTINDRFDETNDDLNLKVDQKLEEISAVVEMQLDQFLVCMDQKLKTFAADITASPAKSDAPSDSLSNSPAFEDSAFETSGEEADNEIDAIAKAVENCAAQNEQAHSVSETFSGTDDAVSTQENENDESHLSEWDRRKQKMLAEYGMTAEEIATHAAVSFQATSGAKTGTMACKKAIQAELAPSNSQTEDSDSPSDKEKASNGVGSMLPLGEADQEEVEALKNELTEKLREAEVELSISRAKLSQQWAALEQKQADISQRETTLHSKYGNLSAAAKKAGLLGRFSRHLSRKSPPKEE